MPTYEYRCEKCDRTFDYVQSMSDPRLETCIYEGCGGKVRRLLGRGAGILFKGSGFYETDYRSDSYKAAKKAESGSSEGGKSPEKKSEPAGAGASSGGGGSTSSPPAATGGGTGGAS